MKATCIVHISLERVRSRSFKQTQTDGKWYNKLLVASRLLLLKDYFKDESRFELSFLFLYLHSIFKNQHVGESRKS